MSPTHVGLWTRPEQIRILDESDDYPHWSWLNTCGRWISPPKLPYYGLCNWLRDHGTRLNLTLNGRGYLGVGPMSARKFSSPSLSHTCLIVFVGCEENVIAILTTTTNQWFLSIKGASPMPLQRLARSDSIPGTNQMHGSTLGALDQLTTRWGLVVHQSLGERYCCASNFQRLMTSEGRISIASISLFKRIKRRYCWVQKFWGRSHIQPSNRPFSSGWGRICRKQNNTANIRLIRTICIRYRIGLDTIKCRGELDTYLPPFIPAWSGSRDGYSDFQNIKHHCLWDVKPQNISDELASWYGLQRVHDRLLEPGVSRTRTSKGMTLLPVRPEMGTETKEVWS